MKLNYNRPELSSSEIEKRQDFNTILNQIKTVKPYLFKKILFYGAMGLSSIAGIFILNSTTLKTSTKKTYGTKITLNKTNYSNKPLLINKDVNPTISANKPLKSVINSTIEKVNFQEQKVDFTPEIKIDTKQIQQTNSLLPKISGVEYGTISSDQFLNAKKVETSNSSKIVSYSINYFKISNFIEKEIIGDELPDELKNEILTYHNQLPVSITNIKYIDTNNQVNSLPSIRLFIK
jgi:hypothetical protein